MNRDWEEIGKQPSPSWYLDPLAAAQKREVHLALIRRWWAATGQEFVLKTDLFEEAFGADFIMPDFAPGAKFLCGIDTAFSTARAASLRAPGAGFAACDARRMCFRPAAFHIVVSTSTLDHFENREDFFLALREIHALLRPGGLLILTLDNPSNPLYWPLRLLSRTRLAPFLLGYTPSPGTLKRALTAAGFEVERAEWLLHNPRLISTALFLCCRKLFGRRADAPIAWLLAFFALLGRLPTKRWTACFQAVAARKPAR